jgi:hypothetical protein
MFIVMTDSFPGYWGSGDTIELALESCKKHRGRTGPWLVIEIDPFYKDANVDGMGQIWANAVDDTIDKAEWPKVIAKVWRRGTRGKMTPVSWPDLQPA